MKKNWLIIAVSIMLIISNFSVSVGYSLKIKNVDSSLQGLPLLFYPEENNPFNYICVLSGDTLVINQKVSGIVEERVESTWIHYPVKAKAKIGVSFKKDREISDRKVESLMLFFAIVRKDDSSLEELSAAIPVLFPKGHNVPINFVNDVAGWSFTKEELQAHPGKLLTLDIDFGKQCSLNCAHCFRQNNKADQCDNGKEMKFNDIVNVIKQAKALGCQSVKFLGAGEPLETPKIIDLLRVLRELEITPLIFTKGHVFGNDYLTRKLYEKKYGFSSGAELVAELDRLGVSFLLGANSFIPAVQDKMVGGIIGYTQKRNKALGILCAAELNKPNPTRVGLIAAPITNDNYDELYDIYCWSKLRNLQVVFCPTMVSGRCGNENSWRQITPSTEQLVNLYTKIYQFNLEYGFQTIKQIQEEGISSYAGFHPCNQVSCGMYVTLNGTVLRCPGDDVTILGNIWEQSLANIWHQSENYGRCGQFNCGCPPKYGKSIPHNLYTDVMRNLKA
jgi:MoaA/NifB/PqqE/SkfB family radical SAM enzyme